MPKYWKQKNHNHRPKKLTGKEKFQLILVAVVFSIVFILYFVYSFFSNCIFRWPIRWDVKSCWNEQIDPASKKAAESAANFIP